MEKHTRINSIIKGMSQFEKRWFARALCGMVLADDVIDQGEIGLMKRFITLIKDDAIRGEVNQILTMGIKVVLEKHPFTQEQKINILFEVAAMSFADRSIDDAELVFLSYVGTQLDLTQNVIQEVTRLATDQCVIEMQKHNLIHQAGS